MINTNGIITTVAGDGFSIGGAGGYGGDGGQATAAELFTPSGVICDATRNLYIADYGNNCIRKVDTSGVITTIAGNGNETGTFSGDGGQATAAKLHNPFRVAIDVFGNLYIADLSNNRIRVINTTGIINSIAGNGTGAGTFPCSICYGGDGGAATAAKLYQPSGVAFDASGNLYIADAANYRVRMVTNVVVAGIEAFANDNKQINIYPNPNNGSFVVELNSTTKQTMQVYDISGKMVLSQSISGKTSIDAGNLNEGVYNISLQSNEVVVNKRLVIVR